ncbi:MAG: asparaginase [Sphingomonadaceae bacterium]
MTTPHIRILATGGTIAGKAHAATGKGYDAGQAAIADILAGAASFDFGMELDGIDVAQIGSQDIGWPVWNRLHDLVAEAMEDKSITGILITHGTDTAEETAFLLDLTLPASKPVVLVGAMRPMDAVGTDGLRNFANALQVAGDPNAHGRGVLLVMGDHVLSAVDARKAATTHIDAFAGFPRGPLANVTPAGVKWYGPADRIGAEARFAWPTNLPRVEIVYAAAGEDAAMVNAALAAGAQGLVLAGMGQGNAPTEILDALAQAVTNGILVVRASRVDQGPVERNVEVDDDALGFVAARNLNPQKARILVQMALADNIRSPAGLQAVFDMQ